ncbi:MAG TPA: hypothetical protein VJK02_09720, partial [Anaerolineales bacterium]|nr:hypothetical protein [Anaerolineales bacterium]
PRGKIFRGIVCLMDWGSCAAPDHAIRQRPTGKEAPRGKIFRGIVCLMDWGSCAAPDYAIRHRPTGKKAPRGKKHARRLSLAARSSALLSF